MLFAIVSKALRRSIIASVMMVSGHGFAASGGVSQATMAKLVDPDQILAGLTTETDRVRVIVEFAMPVVPDAAQAGSGAAADAARASAVHQRQDEIIGRVFATAGGVSGALSADGPGIRRMDFSPMFAVSADKAMLADLAADPAVVRIHEDALARPSLIQSLPLIGMPTAYAGGPTGNGWHVAVLDTGARWTHEFLSSGVVSAACYSTSFGATSFSLCPGGAESSTAIDSAPDCDPATIDGCGHGTHVSGIAAGFNTDQSSGEPANGVARNASLITINVFSLFTSSAACGSAMGSTGCVLSYTSDQIHGLERVYALRDTYAIAAVNMSLGDGLNAAACDGDSRKPIIETLRAAGIATVIAAGNDGANAQVGAPACISSAITVASSTKADVRSDFSNWGVLIDLVAPGNDILSSYLDGSSDAQYATQNGVSTATPQVVDTPQYTALSGTSMAAPHVAGAFAALRSARPTATVSEIETALENTGTNISSSNTTKPRINVGNALTALNFLNAKAVMSSPAAGSKLGLSATFNWTAGTGVSEYWLTLGSTGLGSKDIYDASTGTSKSKVVNGLPANSTIYVRLWSKISSVWERNDYVYSTGFKALMSLPVPGSNLASTATFKWAKGSGVSEYWLYVGSTGAGSHNLYDQSTGTETSRVLSGLPATGTIYVRLYSFIGESWQHVDYTYGTGAVLAAIISPAPGSALDPTATFAWTTGTGVEQYTLMVGTIAAGSGNIFNQNLGASTSATVTGLPTTGTIYVRLWSYIAGSWEQKSYTYTASGKAIMTTPVPGSAIWTTETFKWTTGTGVSEYWLQVGSTGPGSKNIHDATNGVSKTRTVNGLPSSGTTYVRLWSKIGGVWLYSDYTYTAVAKAVMYWPAPGSTLGSTATFKWTPGNGVGEYWLYVGSAGAGSKDILNSSNGTSTTRSVSGLPSSGTIYARLFSKIEGAWYSNDYTYAAGVDAKAVMMSPSPSSPLGSSTAFKWTSGTGVSEYWLSVGSTTAGSKDIYYASTGTNVFQTVTGIPSSGTIRVRLWSKVGGAWLYNDYTYAGSAKAVMMTPLQGAFVSSKMPFIWTPGTGATEYWLAVGTTGAGSKNIHDGTSGTAKSATVQNLLTSGTIYVRLWSKIGGNWVFNDYTYTGTQKGAMVVPAQGSALDTGAVFSWTEGAGATEYWLTIGSTGAGSGDILDASNGNLNFRLVKGLPASGAIYVRLWSKIGGAWTNLDYVYGTGAAAGDMISPVPGSVIGPSATFKWSSGNGVKEYWLSVGTTGPGSENILGQSGGTTASMTVSGLPSIGTIYVRLFSQLSGGPLHTDYTYVAGDPNQ